MEYFIPLEKWFTGEPQMSKGHSEASMSFDRRGFLKTGLITSAVTALSRSEFAAATQTNPAAQQALPPSSRSKVIMGQGDPRRTQAFAPLPYTNSDELTLAQGFSWYPLLRMGDVINAQGDTAGDCCDYLHFMPGRNAYQAFLWVNHEYVIDTVLYGKPVDGNSKTKAQVDHEMTLVGGSYVELTKERTKDGAERWKVKPNSVNAFRLSAHTPIAMVGPAGGRTALGTMANCSGGYTPWGNILTAEENFDVFYGTRANGFRSRYGWGKYYKRSELDYGWVVEVDPQTRAARKLTALGRFAHESATVTVAQDKRVVVYMGDDAKGECLYKFISKNKLSGDPRKDADLLVEGQLYVANLSRSEWISLSPDNPDLGRNKKFSVLKNILTYTREAAQLVGGTRLNRPEDIEVDPETGDVYFTLTNFAEAGDPYGSLNLIREKNGDAASLHFEFETFLKGGLRSGVSCPDNLTFGPQNSLWVCTDMSASAMGKTSLERFDRNSMFRVETDASGSVFARHFLQAPRDAELTGPTFLPDGSGLLLSVQHPGESSFSKKGIGYTSHWPDGGESKPVSTVVCVYPTDQNRERFSR